MSAWAEKYSEAFKNIAREHALAVENLTERQLSEAIRQAVACWDFQKLVVVTRDGEHAQQVIYIPFAEQARLQARIQELEERLQDIEDQDFPDHDEN